MSEPNKDLAAKGEHPSQKQLDKIYLGLKSTNWIDFWNKDGTLKGWIW
jgi:hypothetical protein